MVQLLPFSLARFLPTTASTHLKHLPEVDWNSQVLGEPIPCWFQEHALFYSLKLSSIHLICCMFFLKMVFAFERKVPRIKASVFKGHHLDFILVDSVVDKRSKTSTPPFVWSYTTHTLGFFCWSFVVLTWSWMVGNRITFFLSLFYLST